MNEPNNEVILPDRRAMDADAYHRHPAVGSSSLKHILRSPAHYKQERDYPSPPTPAQRMGSAIHMAILEPEQFEANAVMIPKFGGKGARADLQAWQNANKGKLILKSEEMQVIDGILGSIRNHKTASGLLSKGRAEESFFWQDPVTGIVCKCRPDLWKEGVIVDVKSSLNASPDDFPKSMANLQYHLQAAFYLDGVAAVLGEPFEDFTIVAVEKEPPYAVATYRLDEATIDAGRILYRKALRILRQCKMRGYYPGYADRLIPASLPSWAWPTDAYDRDGFFVA